MRNGLVKFKVSDALRFDEEKEYAFNVVPKSKVYKKKWALKIFR